MCFYDNFIQLCKLAGKTPANVVSEIGLSRAAIFKWKNGTTPNASTVRKIAEYFHVDVSALVGDIPISTLSQENEQAVEASEDMVEGIRIDRLAKCADIVTMLSTTSDENIDLVLALVKKITGEQ